eukprot:TRINITY_DN28448_c0_g1_i2.p1 TRINITY_DN28448_c0_g1~~TRINITY_DN28448_c0_g1_i2.p1  ORF type:complete len:264 (+),score=103.66 TRINITY_DN28448_c0_g1_i2:109-900(+)
MLPPVFVAVCFMICSTAAAAAMLYVTFRGSKPSDFFSEAVKSSYEMVLPQEEIDAYFELKDKYVEAAGSRAEATGDELPPPAHRFMLTDQLTELKKALMRRIMASIDRLDQVQRDKPGNYKLWREKLVSEHYWATLCEAEKIVGEEIDACCAEADELEPGWKPYIFRQAVQMWRMTKQREFEKKMEKKEKQSVKKQKVQALKAVELEAKQAVVDKEKQEREAAKMMAKLIAEEEKAEKMQSKKSGGGGGKAKVAATKSAGKKK